MISLFDKDGLSAIEVWGQSERGFGLFFARFPQKRLRDDEEDALKAHIDILFADLK